MHTKRTALIIAVSAALMTSGALSAQVKEGESDFQPVDPSRGLSDLPGIECTEASGTGCPIAIPDAPGQPVVSQFTIDNCDGAILDANVGFDITHTWVGDLVVTVVAPDATEVVLYDPTPLGCSGNNMFTVADDGALVAMDTVCTAGTPTIDGTYLPHNPLAALNGSLGNGPWSLRVQDTAAADTGTLNNWSLVLSCGEPQPRATFEVNKVFTDDNPQEVEVTLSCFTGLPLVQSQSVSESQNVTFVVVAYDDGELDCNITENPVPGYSASYASGFPGNADADGCHYEDLAFSATTSCTITNEPEPVDVIVNKDWIIDGTGGDELNPAYELTLYCDGEIVGGQDCGGAGGVAALTNGEYGGGCYDVGSGWIKTLYEGTGNGTSDVSYTAEVVPDWDGGTSCWVDEEVYSDAVEVDNGCGNIHVAIGEGDECTITNTVFYEGIPTLDQYGMAVLALMLLGVGFIGFRRLA